MVPYRGRVDFLIRAARVDDAEAIAAVRTRSWRESYAHILSPEFLAALDPTAGVAGLRAAIGRGATMPVAEVDGEVRGFAIAGPAREDDAPRDLELNLIYQLASLHGSGSGQALLDSAIADRPAFLWVAELNPRAIAFYRRNGFEADGAAKVSAEWENLAEIRMVR